ncbi:MAG TPA: DUF4198 domain-containing protein [Ideonella sp.]|uniref:DUF4198 domain-containing protein n=1 Tax=Ideonella sp. TaxID=1929293 RepID=UPI002BC6BCC5|nr:DUF4198 domain-containing protein [Ideonella sp.]HSI49964.1 DUF4198 domain-containing protein [Ideonella sp.]
MKTFTSSLRRSALTAALLAVLAPLAHAHHPWIAPTATLVDNRDGAVSFDAATSEALFEYDARGLPLDGLVVTGPDGANLPVEKDKINAASRHRSSFDLTLPKPGTYRVANVSESVMASYKLGSETKRFRGTLEAWAKEKPADATDVQVTQMASRVETFVARNTPSSTPFAPVGKGIELIPLTAPVDISTGDTSRFRVLVDGQPYANAAVSLLQGGNRYRYKMGEQNFSTDAKGEFAIQWTDAGRYWLGISQGGRGPGGPAAAPAADAAKPAAPARRLSYAATLEVLPR